VICIKIENGSEFRSAQHLSEHPTSKAPEERKEIQKYRKKQDDKFFQGLEHLLPDRNLLPPSGHGILFTTAVLHAVARQANSQREHFLLTVPTVSW
jgi:hypothetical protein